MQLETELWGYSLVHIVVPCIGLQTSSRMIYSNCMNLPKNFIHCSEEGMCRKAHAHSRSNRGSWTQSYGALILSQEVELILSPLCTFPARGELASRECSDPGTQGEITIFSPVSFYCMSTQESTGHRSSRASGTGSYGSTSAARIWGCSATLCALVLPVER